MTAQEYLDFMRSRGRKETTIEGYAAAIRACERCLREGGRPTDPETVDEGAFFYLRTHLAMKETSMQTRMRAYAEYIDWATGRNPMKRAKILWNPLRYDVVRIDRGEFRTLLDYTRDAPPLRIMLLLGGMMGLRRTEIAAIRMEDVRGDTITVRGKGHGEGNIQPQHVPTALQQELRVYTEWRARRLEADHRTSEYLVVFTDRYGHVSLPKYRKEAVSYAFEQLSEHTGIHVTPHSLRRLFATALYDDGHGADIRTISRLMRHATPTITWRYIAQNEDLATEVSDSLGGLLLNIPSEM